MPSYQLSVCLTRDSVYGPWGFRIQGGGDRNVTVLRVQPCTAAEGQVKVADHILTINGMDTRKLSHQQASDMIRNAGSTLRMNILRNDKSDEASSSQEPKPSRYRTEGVPDVKKINTNQALAKLMTQSLAELEETQNGNRKPRRGLAGIELIMRSPTDREEVLDYLPKAISRSTTPLPMHFGGSSGGGGGGGPPPDPRRQSFDAASTEYELQVQHGRHGAYGDTTDRSEARSTLWDSVRRATRGSSVTAGGTRSRHDSYAAESESGRSTPQTIEFGQQGKDKPQAVGVWTPPDDHPGAKLVHNQYNSPMGLYTPSNVADTIQKSTGKKLSWQKKPPVRFADDIHESPTYKMVHGEEEGAEPVAQQAVRIEQQQQLEDQQPQQQPQSYTPAPPAPPPPPPKPSFYQRQAALQAGPPRPAPTSILRPTAAAAAPPPAPMMPSVRPATWDTTSRPAAPPVAHIQTTANIMTTSLSAPTWDTPTSRAEPAPVAPPTNMMPSRLTAAAPPVYYYQPPQQAAAPWRREPELLSSLPHQASQAQPAVHAMTRQQPTPQQTYSYTRTHNAFNASYSHTTMY